jgi:hypothetical protein
MLKRLNEGAQPSCRVRLDRYRFVVPYAGLSWKRRIPSISGFKLTKDFELPSRGDKDTYRRVRIFENLATDTKVVVQHRRAHGYLKPYRVTAIGCDATGILWPDLNAIANAFPDALIRMVELAFDFASATRINQSFILKHAKFGKSRPAHNPKHPDTLHFGKRRSAKFVRCYWKEQVSAYRVELELHGQWSTLPQSEHLLYLLTIGPEDFRFVNFDWDALDSHLRAKAGRGKRIAAGSRLHSESIHELLGYLRSVGIRNPHQFFRTSEKDVLIRNAMSVWNESLSPRVRNRSAK